MTRKKRRLYFLILGLLGLGTAVALTLAAFQDNIVFFYSPSQLQAQGPSLGQRSFRLGGLVLKGSVKKQADGVTVAFIVTDTVASVPVSYKGQLPDLFREGQGVVAEGRIGNDGVFVAREVLAKHDENYMPPEVAQALKDADHFKATAKTLSKTTP